MERIYIFWNNCLIQRKTDFSFFLTQTEIIELSPTQRIDEIARMLGGSQLTPHALAHAKELVAITE